MCEGIAFLAIILAVIIVGKICSNFEMWYSIRVGHAIDWSLRTSIGRIYWVTICIALVSLTYLIAAIGLGMFCSN